MGYKQEASFNLMMLQVIRVLVVRLQQQATGWTSGSASHGTGKTLINHCLSPTTW